MTTPNITPAQLKADLTLIVGQAVAWGVLGNTTAQLVVSIGSVALAAVLTIADSIIRHGRARVAAAQEIGAITLEQQTKPPQ